MSSPHAFLHKDTLMSDSDSPISTLSAVLFDVVAIHMKTDAVRIVAQNITEKEAKRVITAAARKHGLGEEFFTYVEQCSTSKGHLP